MKNEFKRVNMSILQDYKQTKEECKKGRKTEKRKKDVKRREQDSEEEKV